MAKVKTEICENINNWMCDYYSVKDLDLQDVCYKELGEDLPCILLDINLYRNATLVSNAFKLLIRNFT